MEKCQRTQQITDGSKIHDYNPQQLEDFHRILYDEIYSSQLKARPGRAEREPQLNMPLCEYASHLIN